MLITDSVLVLSTEVWSMYLSCSIEFSSASFCCITGLDMHSWSGFIPSIFFILSLSILYFNLLSKKKVMLPIVILNKNRAFQTGTVWSCVDEFADFNSFILTWVQTKAYFPEARASSWSLVLLEHLSGVSDVKDFNRPVDKFFFVLCVGQEESSEVFAYPLTDFTAFVSSFCRNLFSHTQRISSLQAARNQPRAPSFLASSQVLNILNGKYR